jgi:hypothetical protein
MHEKVMKKAVFSAIVGYLFQIFCFSISAQEENTPIALSLSGYVLADDRIHTEGRYEFSWQEYRLDLKSELKAFGRAKFFGDVWLRGIGFSSPRDIAEQQKTGSVSPQNLSLREAYVSLYGLGLPNLDVTVGRQRIAWGTADKINPTDNINPYDLEDFWDFGRHLGSDGLKAVYYLGNFTLTGVFIPLFKPAVLPMGDWINAFETPMPPIQGFHVTRQTDTISMPQLTLRESSTGALKFGGRIFDIDFSASYTFCRDGIPLVDTLTLVPKAHTVRGVLNDLTAFGALDSTTAKVHLMFPRLHVVGFDFSSAIAKLGIWGEAAVFIPEKRINMVTRLGGNVPVDSLMQIPGVPQTEVQQLYALSNGGIVSAAPALDSKPYVKFVVGLDYTFPSNVYVNAQYIHGFVQERGDSLEDYIMSNVDWSLLNNKLKVSPLGLGLEIKDFRNFSDSYALIGQPQVTWFPIDNAELCLGVRLIYGKAGTYFGTVTGDDEAYVKIMYSF